MTVHRVALRAGVVTAAVAALVAGFLSTPAHAQPQLRLGNIGNIELRVGGGPQSVTITVQNASNDPVNGVAQNVQLTMVVPLAEVGVSITSAGDGCNLTNDNTRMDCNLGTIGPGETRNVVAQIGVAGNSPVQSGDTRNGTAQVALSGGGQTSFNIRVQGPDRPPPVAEVSGFVTDEITGEPISNATVFLTDSQGAEFTRTTNDSGQFSFQGEDIAGGTIGLRASADGYEGNSITQNVDPGGSLTGIQLALRSTTPPTSEPPPTTEPATTAPPTTAPVAAEDSGEGGGGGTFTTIMIILGILFVLLGVGAIAYLIYRRRREQGEDEDPDDGADEPFGPRGPTPTPGSQGVYRPTPTQVMGPRGPLPAVGPQPALANAPTMMHPRAGADETALLPRAGDAPTSPIRPAGPRPPAPGSPPPPRPAGPAYGTPASATQAFDSPTGRHGSPPERYDEPTQVRQPYSGGRGNEYGGGSEYGGGAYGSPAGRHEQPGHRSSYDNSSYGPDPYTQPQPGYDRGDYRGGGYDRGGDYRSGGYQSGDYDQGGGYQEPGGYQQGGYGDQDYHQSGYDRYDQPTQQRGGYDNGYPPEQAAPRSSRHSADPPERRRLDWLDQ